MRHVAEQYGVPVTALLHYKTARMPTQLARAKEVEAASDADDLLARLEALTRYAQRIERNAEAAGDYRAALAGIRELVRIVELLAKLRGELDARPVVNILVSPEWQCLRRTLLEAIMPYPDARVAVSESLNALEQTSQPARSGPQLEGQGRTIYDTRPETR